MRRTFRLSPFSPRTRRSGRPAPSSLPGLALGALLATLLAAPALAGPRHVRPYPSPVAEPVQMTVVDRDHGDWLPLHPHRGEQWVAGQPGHRYAVRLTNTSDRRVLVVLSVDGVNAVSGETADPSQAGYVLEPWQSTEIGGWRKSLGEVAQFVFTDPRNSYASRTGRPRNVGVIGIAVFEEAWRPHRYPRAPGIAKSEASRAGAPAADMAEAPAEAESRGYASRAERQRLGTGHGQREWSPASRTHFVRASRHPSQVSEIRYDTRAQLVARGIIPRWRHRHDDIAAPSAFPGGFVADPPR